MCLAIYKPAGAVIPEEHLENGYQINDDGCGFCYAENGKLHVVKGLLTFPDFLKQYREKEHLAMLIHFRMSTHCGKNKLNCHPFSICDGKYALIHNGVISIHCTIKELSDTGNFAKLVMEPMLKAGVHPRKPAFFFLVEQAIGSHNKVCLMDCNGDVTIYNEDSGEYENAVDKDGNEIIFTGNDGKKYNETVWYSNGGYKYSRRSRATTRRNHHDEYEGYFDGSTGDYGAGECGVAEMTTSIGEGFAGVKKEEVGSQFTHKPPLDPPPNRVITGFNPGGEKSAQASAEAILQAQKKDTIRIKLPPKDAIGTPAPAPLLPGPRNIDHSITPVDTGPIFGAKAELEIAYVMSEMSVTRKEAIKMLDIGINEAVTIIE